VKWHACSATGLIEVQPSLHQQTQMPRCREAILPHYCVGGVLLSWLKFMSNMTQTSEPPLSQVTVTPRPG
jgi:hypothetical protein